MQGVVKHKRLARQPPPLESEEAQIRLRYLEEDTLNTVHLSYDPSEGYVRKSSIVQGKGLGSYGWSLAFSDEKSMREKQGMVGGLSMEHVVEDGWFYEGLFIDLVIRVVYFHRIKGDKASTMNVLRQVCLVVFQELFIPFSVKAEQGRLQLKQSEDGESSNVAKLNHLLGEYREQLGAEMLDVMTPSDLPPFCETSEESIYNGTLLGKEGEIALIRYLGEFRGHFGGAGVPRDLAKRFFRIAEHARIAHNSGKEYVVGKDDALGKPMSDAQRKRFGRFMKRYNWVCRKVAYRAPRKLIAQSPETVATHFFSLRRAIASYPEGKLHPCLLANVDEACARSKIDTPAYVPKGEKYVFLPGTMPTHSYRGTICMYLLGTGHIPTALLIVPRASHITHAGLQFFLHFKGVTGYDGIKAVCVASSSNAGMNSSILRAFVICASAVHREFVLRKHKMVVNRKQPILLYLDQENSRMTPSALDGFVRSSVMGATFGSNMTHLLQPADNEHVHGKMPSLVRKTHADMIFDRLKDAPNADLSTWSKGLTPSEFGTMWGKVVSQYSVVDVGCAWLETGYDVLNGEVAPNPEPFMGQAAFERMYKSSLHMRSSRAPPIKSSKDADAIVQRSLECEITHPHNLEVMFKQSEEVCTRLKGEDKDSIDVIDGRYFGFFVDSKADWLGKQCEHVESDWFRQVDIDEKRIAELP